MDDLAYCSDKLMKANQEITRLREALAECITMEGAYCRTHGGPHELMENRLIQINRTVFATLEKIA